MSFAKRNSHSTASFTLRTNSPSYVSLMDLFQTYGSKRVFPFYAIYINRKGNYGPQACLALNEKQIVNLPQHLLEDCEKMMSNADDLADINSGKAGFRIYQYQTKNGRTGLSVEWVDVDPGQVDPNTLPF